MSSEDRAAWSRPKKLEHLLGQLIDTGVFKTHREFAAECGISDQGLSQALSNPQRRLSVEQCLRLARKIRHHPVSVLRAAGRDEAADILDDLWPRKRDMVALTRSEVEVIKLWRDLTTVDRHHLSALIEISARRSVEVLKERAVTGGRERNVKRGGWPAKRKVSG